MYITKHYTFSIYTKTVDIMIKKEFFYGPCSGLILLCLYSAQLARNLLFFFFLYRSTWVRSYLNITDNKHRLHATVSQVLDCHTDSAYRLLRFDVLSVHGCFMFVLHGLCFWDRLISLISAHKLQVSRFIYTTTPPQLLHQS